MTDLINRLRAEEARMEKLFDLCVQLRGKYHGNAAFTDFNALKHALSGRDPVLTEAAKALTAAEQRAKDLEAALLPLFAVADEFAQNYLRDEYRDEELCLDRKHYECVVALFAALTRARSALSTPTAAKGRDEAKAAAQADFNSRIRSPLASGGRGGGSLTSPSTATRPGLPSSEPDVPGRSEECSEQR